MSKANVKLVEDCYAAYGSGDIERLLAALAPDVEWELVGRSSDFPAFGQWHGIDGARAFLDAVADTLEMQAFAPREFHAVGRLVFVLGSYECTVKKTGRRTGSEWLHVFWVDDGKVTRFREFTDTARIVEAWRA